MTRHQEGVTSGTLAQFYLLLFAKCAREQLGLLFSKTSSIVPLALAFLPVSSILKAYLCLKGKAVLLELCNPSSLQCGKQLIQQQEFLC